jgi:hypothetical protein
MERGRPDVARGIRELCGWCSRASPRFFRTKRESFRRLDHGRTANLSVESECYRHYFSSRQMMTDRLVATTYAHSKLPDPKVC